MTTDLLYLDDAYSTDFEAQIVALSDTAVALDRTLFYPRGGGQMADTGTLRIGSKTAKVVAVEKREGLVWHTLDGQIGGLGEKVRGHIHWDHRYTMMRTHTALHILCGVIYHQYGATVTGCQMYPDRARMDFTLADLTPERLRRIEQLSNDAIRAGHAVRTRWHTREEAERIPDLVRTKINLLPPEMDRIRTVEIVGLDLQADGGTHVRNTFEVGGITITKSENKGKENKRIEIVISELVG